jgi:hypothetical protein
LKGEPKPRSERNTGSHTPSPRSTIGGWLYASEIQDGAQALIDDRAVTLVDLSVAGAQILSPALLWRPGQLVQVVLSKEEVIQCQAGIVCGGFEILRQTWTPYYRAGVSFKNADPRTIERLLRGSGLFDPQ